MDSETKNGRPRHGGGRAYRSRLEPFAGFIRELRQQRKTWQEIAEQIHTEKNCPVTFQGVYQFYRRYVKRHARPHWENEPVESTPARPIETAIRPESHRPMLAATPTVRSFRQPNPHNMNLNDPTKV